jgi:hypothetical protein
MPRASYDSVVIETMFDYHYFLDKVADYLFRSFDNQTQSQHASHQGWKSAKGTP